jgi:hypothetical protein
MIMAQEQSILKAKDEFDQMVAAVRKAAAEGQRIDLVERDLWQRMLGISRLMLQGFVDLQGPGDLGVTLEHEGRTLNRLEDLHDRRYVSVFGELLISRVVYGSRETQKHEVVPLDARLCLPESDFSYLLQEWDQSFCVQGSYARSNQSIDRILNIGQSIHSLEDMNRFMAQDVEMFQDSQPIPKPEEEGPLLVLTADGKGVPMRRNPDQDTPAPQGRRKKGEKANKKRMACVGAVYSIEPFKRTVDDVVNDILRESRRKDRPSPQNKRMRGKLTRQIEGIETTGKEQIFSWFEEQLEFRNPDGSKPMVCVMDGERALWKMLDSYEWEVVRVLDIYHVLEYLWDAAYCFCFESGDTAQKFVTERLRRILEGDVGRVIGGFKQMATKHNLRGNRKKTLFVAINYLQRNRHAMHYDEYLANGYPIGSGVVEGACRHFVKDRMELTGMRWRTDGAQAMLDLRSVFLNDDWEVFQEHRIEANSCKLYPNRELIESQWNTAA